MEIKDAHVLVTGGAKRVGRVISQELLARNAKVTIHYFRSQQSAEAFVGTAGARAQSVQADLKECTSIAKAVETASKNFGPIDILVNCASDFYPLPMFSCTEEAWDTLMNTNLRGQFFFARECARKMCELRKGVIINIADVYSERPLKNYIPYTITKAGVLSLTRGLAHELAKFQVRVNSVSPGAVLLPENYTEEQKEKSSARTLLGRLGSPQDIAQAVLFLIENDYITGMNLRVDGGRSII